MKLIFEYDIADVVKAFSKETIDSLDEFDDKRQVTECAMFAILSNVHSIGIDLPLTRLYELTRLDMHLMQDVVEDHISNTEYREIASTFKHIEAISNIKHIGYNTFEVIYEDDNH